MRCGQGLEDSRLRALATDMLRLVDPADPWAQPAGASLAAGGGAGSRAFLLEARARPLTVRSLPALCLRSARPLSVLPVRSLSAVCPGSRAFLLEARGPASPSVRLSALRPLSARPLSAVCPPLSIRLLTFTNIYYKMSVSLYTFIANLL